MNGDSAGLARRPARWALMRRGVLSLIGLAAGWRCAARRILTTPSRCLRKPTSFGAAGVLGVATWRVRRAGVARVAHGSAIAPGKQVAGPATLLVGAPGWVAGARCGARGGRRSEAQDHRHGRERDGSCGGTPCSSWRSHVDSKSAAAPRSSPSETSSIASRSTMLRRPSVPPSASRIPARASAARRCGLE